jgi:hypothetical protein
MTTTLIKEGSTWETVNSDKFRILHVIELDNRTWVHYYSVKQDIEYSCLLESFLERFSQVPK